MHSTDAVYSCKRSSVVCLYVCLCVSLGLLATTRSRAKTDEPIECRLGGTRPGLGYMGPTNHVLDRGVHILPREGALLRGTYAGGQYILKATHSGAVRGDAVRLPSLLWPLAIS